MATKSIVILLVGLMLAFSPSRRSAAADENSRDRSVETGSGDELCKTRLCGSVHKQLAREIEALAKGCGMAVEFDNGWCRGGHDTRRAD